MELNLILASLVAFCGIAIGIIQSIISPEEMKSGKRYFRLMQNVIIILIILISTVFQFWIGWIAVILLLRKDYIDYIVLGIILAFSSYNLLLFKILAVAIFLYGFPTGSLLFHNKNKLKIALTAIILFIVAMICTALIMGIF